MLSSESLKQAIHKLFNPSKYIRPKSKTIYNFFMDKLFASKKFSGSDVNNISKFKDESDAYVANDTFQTIFKTIDSVVKLSVVDLLDLPITEYNLSMEYEYKLDNKHLLDEKIENILKELRITKDTAAHAGVDDSERLTAD